MCRVFLGWMLWFNWVYTWVAELSLLTVGLFLQRIFVFMNLSTAGVQKKGPAKKREDKGKLKRRNFLMEVEE